MRPIPSRVRRLAAAALVAAAGLSLAACAGAEQSGPPAVRVATWVSGSGAGPSIGAVVFDARNVDTALARHDPAGEVRSLCALLASDAANANGNLPTPDQQLTDDLSDAYANAYDAGNDCYNGATGDKHQLTTSAQLRAKAERQLDAAVARIAAVTGKVPSTTTTTAPPGSNVDPFGN